MKHFTTSDGLRLAYRIDGKDGGNKGGGGTPLLCLSGLTRNSLDFEFLLPHIPAGFRVIRMDYRGRGGSARDPNFMNYHVPIEARDALELLDHLGIDRTAIIGTSRGGLIAMALASAAKTRLLGVFLNDIGPELDPDGLTRIFGYLGASPPYKTYEEAAATLSALLEGEFSGVPLTRWREAVTHWFDETPDGLTLNYDPKLRDAVLAHFTDPAPDAWPYFDAFAGLPLALVRGGNSDLLTPEGAQKMRTRRPDMIYREVANRAHVPFLDEPEALEALHEFLGALPK